MPEEEERLVNPESSWSGDNGAPPSFLETPRFTLALLFWNQI